MERVTVMEQFRRGGTSVWRQSFCLCQMTSGHVLSGEREGQVRRSGCSSWAWGAVLMKGGEWEGIVEMFTHRFRVGAPFCTSTLSPAVPDLSHLGFR